MPTNYNGGHYVVQSLFINCNAVSVIILLFLFVIVNHFNLRLSTIPRKFESGSLKRKRKNYELLCKISNDRTQKKLYFSNSKGSLVKIKNSIIFM